MSPEEPKQTVISLGEIEPANEPLELSSEDLKQELVSQMFIRSEKQISSKPVLKQPNNEVSMQDKVSIMFDGSKGIPIDS
ncbi:MAG: hypothetical protein WCK31_00170 [bacterium]